MKLYILSAVVVNLDEDKAYMNTLKTYFGYFTNLKTLYGLLKDDNLQSYSTISTRLRKEGIYYMKDTSIINSNHIEFFNEITIRKVEANQMYGMSKHFLLSELISSEISKEDMSLGNLYHMRKL